MKTTSKVLKLFISVLTVGCCNFFYVNTSFADMGCPGTGQLDQTTMTCYYPDGSSGNHVYGNSAGYSGDGSDNSNSGGNSTPIVLPPRASQYGAVALNGATGAYGYSSNESTAQRSKTAAIADCGQSGCKIIAHYSNQCVAFAWGLIKTGSFSPVDVDLNQSIAEQKAMATCDARARECKIIYSGCSLP